MKKVIKWVLITLVVIAGAVIAFLEYLKPVYEGEEVLPGLSADVKVYYDSYGVPHIYAENEEDAMRALGYVHARERLWQMELVSRIATGRLSEIFGEKLIAVDKFYLTLGIAEASKKTVAELDKNSPSYRLTQAYLDGVNTYVDNGKTPLEFYILGIKKKHFSIEDIHNVYGYMAYGFAMANKTDPVVSALYEKLGESYLKQLDIDIDKSTELIDNYEGDDTRVLSSISGFSRQIKSLTPFPAIHGSNSWVLGPGKTKNGKVIFENDPHIEYAQPAVWYEAHLVTPQTEIYGFHLALNPFPLLAHNHHQVYGLTMLENDDIDLYTETLNPNNPDEYKYGGEYLPFRIREEVIPVKGSDSVRFTIKETLHGPVMNAIVPGIHTSHPVSMYWVFTQRPNRLNEAIYRLSRAKDMEEFKKGLPLLHAPGLNVMYGDDRGNIGWWAVAQLYERKSGVSTKMLIDGSKPENHELRFLPFDDNPHAVNPPWGYVYSCNNQPDSLPGRNFVPGYYPPHDRALRVVNNVSKWTEATLEQSLALATDDISSTAPYTVPYILKSLENASLTPTEQKAKEILSGWQFDASTGSRGVTVYSVFIDEFEKALYADEMGELFSGFRHTFLAERMIAPTLTGKYPIWQDDIRTPGKKETLSDIHLAAFRNTVKRISRVLGDDPSKWEWKRLHTVTYKHPLGEVKLFRKFFNVGPFPIAGNKKVLNNQMYDRSADYYRVHAGPSTRRIIDFSDIEHAKAVIPTGQSGNPLSPHYRDQAELYLKGEYRTLLLNAGEIKAESKLLTLTPG